MYLVRRWGGNDRLAVRLVLSLSLSSLASCADEEPTAGEDASTKLDGGARTEDDGGVREDAGMAGDPDANLPDGVDAASDAASTEDAANAQDADTTPPGPPVPDLAASKFVAYGKLELRFDRPVDASALSVTLSPARPANLAVVSVGQSGADGLLVTLNSYHLPLDYTATVTGPDFEVEVALAGMGNGSRTAFISSHSGNGDLRTWMTEAASLSKGRDAGDLVCQSEADAAGLKGVFRAWLSSSQGKDAYDAACRALGRTGKWDQHCGLASAPSDEAPLIDQGGLPLVNGASGMAAREWLSPIRYHADGSLVSSGNVWTGSFADGRATTNNCNGYSESVGTKGTASFRPYTYLLSDTYVLDCDSVGLRLVCVQTGSDFFPKSTLHERTGKAVFVTPTNFSWPSTGNVFTKADAFCQSAASSASYASPENFVAWLSDASQHAPCRLVGSGGVMGGDKCGLNSWPTTGPWVRHDGFVVAANMGELLSGRLAAPLLLTSTGSFVSDGVYTITNTWNDGTPAGACSGGVATSTANWSLFYSPGNCSGLARPIVCFER
jgi:hypothetical protein